MAGAGGLAGGAALCEVATEWWTVEGAVSIGGAAAVALLASANAHCP